MNKRAQRVGLNGIRYGRGRLLPALIHVVENDVPASIESGCVAYLTKPFTAKSPIESVKNACDAAAWPAPL